VLTDQSAVLKLPVAIDAHSTIAGSVIFYLDDELVGQGRIDDFKLVFTDTHDETAFLEPVIIRDLVDEEEAENTKIRNQTSI
jgi:hypothetical protein